MRVVDASVVVDALTACPDLAEHFSGTVSAPHLIDSEVAHALRGMVARGTLTTPQADEAMLGYQSLTIERHAATPLLPRIWELRHTITAYDATYVALAETLEAELLLTTDARLAGAPGIGCPVMVV